jgi:hypothetical protein
MSGAGLGHRTRYFTRLATRSFLALLLFVAFWVAATKTARADVRLEGTWPAQEKTVSLDADRIPRKDAVKRLADAAGWSIVVSASPSETVDVHVKDQPATKVLALVLSDGKYVARRDGDLVLLRADDGAPSQAGPTPPPLSPPPPPPAPPPATAAPAAPPVPPVATSAPRAEDRTVTGGKLKIRREEIVHDVTVFGGAVEVYGTVTGDLAVMGGRAEVHDGAHIVGSATAVGGSLRIRDGARVDGDVGVIGGSLERGDKAQVGGSVVQGSANDDDHDEGKHGKPGEGLGSELLRDVGDAFSHAALLFVFGTIVLALGAKRVEVLRVEVASRPMRSFALGVVGLIAAIALVIAMCVTVVGIPVAIVGILAGAIAVYVGIAAVLTTLGEGLLRHRTKNPSVHLALGCAILLLFGAIPYAGMVAKAFVAFAGIGVLIATRGAGLVPPRSNGVTSFGQG